MAHLLGLFVPLGKACYQLTDHLLTTYTAKLVRLRMPVKHGLVNPSICVRINFSCLHGHISDVRHVG